MQRKPPWLKVKLPVGPTFRKVSAIVSQYNLHTICRSGNCPNIGECWGEGTATFMILGNVCTRSCNFCAVITGRPTELDRDEPRRIAEAVELMGIKHCVLTSVNRDELADKGMGIWAETVYAIKERTPHVTIETLIPDVKGDWKALQLIINARPEVISHNMETVRPLYRKVRPQAKYYRSLEELERIRSAGIRTKSGFMVGLGETEEQVFELMADLDEVGLDVLTIGQYLQPTPRHLPVKQFVPPNQFNRYKDYAYTHHDFDYVESSPLVRSSYHAERHVYPNPNRPSRHN